MTAGPEPPVDRPIDWFRHGRRTFLSVTGVAVATISGCSALYESGEDDDGVAEETDTERVQFRVSINTPSAVVAGEPISISYEVENTGEAEGTQSVTLSVDGVQDATNTVTLGGGESETGEFTISIDQSSDGIANSVPVTVATEDDADNVTILTVARPTDGGTLDIVEWNKTLLEVIRLTAETPTETVRRIAMLTTAMYDAVASIEAARGTARDETYHRYGDHPPGDASPLAALGGAARNTLSGMYPEFAQMFDERLTVTLTRAGELDGDVEAGEAWGRTVGQQAIEEREDDGHRDEEPGGYDPCPGDDPAETPGCWRGGEVGNWRDSHYAFLDPWVLEGPASFPGPPPMDGEEYAESWLEVYELGNDNDDRPQEWVDIATFWRGGPGTARPSGRWLRIANEAVTAGEYDRSLLETAWLMSLVGNALGDAGVSTWHSKHEHGYWRPAEAIEAGDVDGNPETFADPDWKPISVGTNPEYPSALAVYGAAAKTILVSVLDTDDVAFAMRSSGPPEMTRSFDSFSHALEESVESRLFVGNHFGFALDHGVDVGEKIGQMVLKRAPNPFDASDPASEST